MDPKVSPPDREVDVTGVENKLGVVFVVDKFAPKIEPPVEVAVAAVEGFPKLKLKVVVAGVELAIPKVFAPNDVEGMPNDVLLVPTPVAGLKIIFRAKLQEYVHQCLQLTFDLESQKLW